MGRVGFASTRPPLPVLDTSETRQTTMTTETEPNGTDAFDTAAEPVVSDTAEALLGGVEAVSEAAEGTLHSAVDVGQATAATAVEAETSASSETAKAFAQARDRLEQAGVPGLEASQTMFDRVRSDADQAAEQFGSSFGAAGQTLSAFSTKALEAWRTNAESTIAHWQQLAGITSWSELIALNTAHARKQMEAVTAQTRELAEVAGQLARDGAKLMAAPPKRTG